MLIGDVPWAFPEVLLINGFQKCKYIPLVQEYQASVTKVCKRTPLTFLSLVYRNDRTMTGHVLGHANTRSRGVAPERNLSPVLVGITRILMHCAMIEGAHRHPQVSWPLSLRLYLEKG